jgi:hypothetical protein
MWSGFDYVAVGARRDVDQGPNRAISLETEKKACPKLGTPLLMLTWRQSAPFQHHHIIILVNRKPTAGRSTALFAAQHATF